MNATLATRVLLVEDNPGDVALTRQLMSVAAPGEFELVFAGWLRTAIEYVRDEHFDVILLDLGLPDADGTSGLESMLAHAPDCPVVVLSGENDNQTAMSAVRDGAQGYILKGSVDPKQFVFSVRGAILRKKTELDLQKRAFYDDLTGLPTRALLRDRWERMRRRQGRSGKPIGVLVVDLDDFKRINDDHGHIVGDTVLAAAARLIEDAVRRGDTVARIGGDEFVVLLEEISNIADAELVVQKIVASLADGVDVGQRRVPINASVGIAVTHQNRLDSLKDVVGRADADMYLRRNAKRRRICHTGHPRMASTGATARLRAM